MWLTFPWSDRRLNQRYSKSGDQTIGGPAYETHKVDAIWSQVWRPTDKPRRPDSGQLCGFSGSLICCQSGQSVCAAADRRERPRVGAHTCLCPCFILLKQWCTLFRWATADGESEGQQADPGTLCNPSSWDRTANTCAPTLTKASSGANKGHTLYAFQHSFVYWWRKFSMILQHKVAEFFWSVTYISIPLRLLK